MTPTAYVVVPDGIDDPARPSGGNVYDRRVCHELTAGWSVHERAVAGAWPHPDAVACAALTGAITEIPDGCVVLVDGLIASSAPAELLPQMQRLRVVVLVHMPLDGGLGADPADASLAGAREDAREGPRAGAREGEVLRAAVAVVTTSHWTRRLLLERYALPAETVHVATPGADLAEVSHPTAAGGELLCVAAVAPHKGHDVLFAALGKISGLPWRCICVGALDRDPGFVDRLHRQAQECGIDGRIHLAGPLAGADLAAAYGSADLLVLVSHAETYGMVVTEALARGIPVLATAVGGVPEAMGHGSTGLRPGLLVAPGDSAAIADALREWLGDPQMRRNLRQAARERRVELTGWSVTADRISQVLAGVNACATGPPEGALR